MDDYKDEEREISLFRDDIVEILDVSKPEKWLVRSKHKNLIQVCYIPPYLLEPVQTDKLQDLEYQKQFSRVKLPPKSNDKLNNELHSRKSENENQHISTVSNDQNTIYTKLAKTKSGEKGIVSTENDLLKISSLATISENSTTYKKSSLNSFENNADKTGIFSFDIFLKIIYTL